MRGRVWYGKVWWCGGLADGLHGGGESVCFEFCLVHLPEVGVCHVEGPRGGAITREEVLADIDWGDSVGEDDRGAGGVVHGWLVEAHLDCAGEGADPASGSDARHHRRHGVEGE